MSSKLRVYEVARDFGMDNKELVSLLQSMGVAEVKNHMSVVAADAIERVKRHLERKSEPKVVEERIRPTVVKRRSVAKPPEPAAPLPQPAPERPVERRHVAVERHPVVAETPPPPAPAVDLTAQPAAEEVKVVATSPVEAVVEARGPAESSAVPVVATVVHEPASPPPPPATEAPATPIVESSAVPEPVVGPAVVAEGAKPARTEGAKPTRTEGPSEAPPVTPAAAAAPTPTAGSKAKGQGDADQGTVGTEVPVVVPPPAPPEATVAAAPVAVEAPVAPVVPPAPVASAVVSPPAAQKTTPVAGAPEPRMTVVADAPRAAAPAPGVPADAAPRVATPSQPPAAPTGPVGARPSSPPPAGRTTAAPRTGIEVWEGRPGVPMSQVHRGPMPRRVQYDAKAGAANLQRRAGQPISRMARGTRGKGPGGPGGPMGPGRGGPMRPVGPPATQERGAHKRIVKIESSVGLQTLAGRMGIKAHELLRKLITLGMTGVNINSNLDADTAKIVASEFGWEVEDVAVSEEQALVIAQGVGEAEQDETGRVPRPPVVTVMGHVDHGKTSLLDRIRKTNVASGEAGGITQHIGAYSVETAGGRITFLDTPGHEAFTSMRARGAQTTDVVILVVAADDGVMPQTREAYNHAKSASVPIVVAVNKCDKPEAQPDRVRRELAELGLVPEEWGGESLFTDVSAHTGKGIDELLEKVLLQAEMLDLRANPDKLAVGVVLEAELDRGRGPVATMLVTEGTLHRGDILLVGGACGKVRAMYDSVGRNVASAGPSTPVEVIGLTDVPAAGDPVHVLRDMKKAQEIADSRKVKERRSLMPMGGPRLSLEDLYKAMKDAEQLELKVIVKADVHGSVEAVSDALTRLSTAKVKVTVVHAAAGAITEGDVNLAVAAGAIIIGFNVRPAGKASSLAQQEKIEIRQYSIIYNVVDDVKAAMEGLLAPSLVEKLLGRVEVRQVFRISKAGNVAGCMVVEGLVRRSGTFRLLRDKEVVWQGKPTSLKRFKEDVREVKEGFDCGISLDGCQDVREGDILECFEVEEVRQTL